MSYPIGELRATIFSAPIIYDSKNIQRVSEVLNSTDEYKAMPFNSVRHANQDPVVLEWEMVSKKNRSKLHFSPQKIDVIKSIFKEGEHSEDEFCKESCDLLFKIIDRFHLSITRIAYAPVYIRDWDDSFTKESFNQLIYNKNEFQGYPLSNIYDFNYVAEASESQSIVHDVRNNSLTIRNMLNLSLDINSRQGAGYVFGENEMKEFFNNADDYGKQFLAYYFG